VRQFVAHEGRLRSLLRALLPNWSDVDEVMQETSLVAWRKFDGFTPDSNFMAWAATIARYEALNHLRQQRREPLVFSDAVIDLIVAESVAEPVALSRERQALDRCLEKLPPPERELLMLSYQPGAKLHEVATKLGRSVQGYYKTIQRLRQRLLECIQSQLKEDMT
tara:strand:- start:6123 stop:6617 length:495 start_codon:yes stop_codon:yes gene_type:complete